MADANLTIEALENVREAMIVFRNDTSDVYVEFHHAMSYTLGQCRSIIDDVKQKIQELWARISSLESDISQQQKQISSLECEIASVSSSMSSAISEKNGYLSQVQNYTNDVAVECRNQELISAANNCQSRISSCSARKSSLEIDKRDAEHRLEEYRQELSSVKSELFREERYRDSLESAYDRIRYSIAELNDMFKSFVHSADMGTSGNIIALDKCIEAISEYMNIGL